MVDDWNANPLDKNVLNPYDEPESDVCLADVRRELIAEEDAELARGTIPVHSVSESKFLLSGLQHEDTQ